MKIEYQDRPAGQAPDSQASQCDDQVKVVTSPMAAESQPDSCSVELDPHYAEDQVHEEFNLAFTGLLFLGGLVMGIAPALIQLGFLIS
ncbi:hypothetical protein SAMN05660443_2815 [Marinospirillum celere]|uniref:Uncharacterized protein n=1 Tax=Marinospirillum celere TaxID=1122252 RepID=A0A1I1JJU2_9GAMM|nr:hypothetical protein [Marinospirillum celere]SFC48232.1 hypothetical protein SAMN05660443_2815 [Marinospirillum celere]